MNQDLKHTSLPVGHSGACLCFSCWELEMEDQNFKASSYHIVFEASLGYMTPSLTTNTSNNNLSFLQLLMLVILPQQQTVLPTVRKSGALHWLWRDYSWLCRRLGILFHLLIGFRRSHKGNFVCKFLFSHCLFGGWGESWRLPVQPSYIILKCNPNLCFMRWG